jgi:hypothetical protein
MQVKLIVAHEQDTLLKGILETVESFEGDLGRREHALKNIAVEWFWGARLVARPG